MLSAWAPLRTHVSLCAGVDAIGIAASHLGYRTTAAVEIDPYCRSILRKRLPDVAIHEDVHDVGAAELGSDIDLLSAGFPCPGFSSAGKGRGFDDPRSRIWFEILRIIGECRPRMVLIENVAVLRSRGLDVVVAGFAEKSYSCWWDSVPALAVGAPHIRDRIWITAVPDDRFPLVAMGRLMGDDEGVPRAGSCHGGRVMVRWPQATVKMCKEALGAVKREDGVTWLTKIDQPLFPTPSASSYGSNRGGGAGRVGPVRHSLSSMARSGDWPRMWPTSSARDYKDDKTGSAHGDQRCWPTPSARTADQGPGRSEHRDGGPNLRTAVADDKPGPLNPDWVEWLLGLPIGHTDVDCDDPVQLDWLSEYNIPRVARDVPNRKQRLMAIGNCLVWRVAYTRLALAHEMLGI